jgi:ATP-dependent DNA helicase RecG
MTATPIPRTLALTVHGDLDVSQIDELPPGRQKIQTTLLTGQQRPQAYDLIRREIAQGRQVYVVLPLVEESEKLDLRSRFARASRYRPWKSIISYRRVFSLTFKWDCYMVA